MKTIDVYKFSSFTVKHCTLKCFENGKKNLVGKSY